MFGTITQNYECSKALLIGWLRRIEFEWLNLIGFQIDTVNLMPSKWLVATGIGPSKIPLCAGMKSISHFAHHNRPLNSDHCVSVFPQTQGAIS